MKSNVKYVRRYASRPVVYWPTPHTPIAIMFVFPSGWLWAPLNWETAREAHRIFHHAWILSRQEKTLRESFCYFTSPSCFTAVPAYSVQQSSLGWLVWSIYMHFYLKGRKKMLESRARTKKINNTEWWAGAQCNRKMESLSWKLRRPGEKLEKANEKER